MDYTKIIDSALEIISKGDNKRGRNYKKPYAYQKEGRGTSLVVPKYIVEELGWDLKGTYCLLKLPNLNWVICPHRQGYQFIGTSDTVSGSVRLYMTAVKVLSGETIEGIVEDELIVFPPDSFEVK